MILVDTSVWVNHLHVGEPELFRLLAADEVLGHPFITGELALGSLRDRREILDLLQSLPSAVVAEPGEVLELIEIERIAAVGIGYVDVSLLTSARLTPECLLWTRDRRLNQLTSRIGLAYLP